VLWVLGFGAVLLAPSLVFLFTVFQHERTSQGEQASPR
jgi:hypothetical protein